MNNINDSYIEIHPTSRDDQLEKVGALFNRPLASFPLLTVECAGMGSGKSIGMCETITRIRQNNDTSFVTIVISPSNHLQKQLLSVFQKYDWTCRVELIYDDIMRKTDRAIREGKIAIVFLNHIASNKGKMNDSHKKLKKLLSMYPGKALVMFDEIDLVLTSITGGINAKLDHSNSMLVPYKKVLEQPDTSLNVFDTMREYGAKCVGLSGTANHFISSKIPSTGLSREEVAIINVHPIQNLYKYLEIIQEEFDAENIDKLIPNLQRIETTEHTKALFIFSNNEQMKAFIKEYEKKMTNPLSFVEITSHNSKQRENPKWREDLVNAKYVFGINLVGTGFDIATFCEGHQFKLGVLFRKLSDKTSQPLSKNSEHALHMEYSTSLLQTIGRLREGGTFIVHNTANIKSLYEGLTKVFTNIRDGHEEAFWVGSPHKNQIDRYNRSILQNLIQNLRDGEDRSVVKDILDALKDNTGRDFKNEYFEVEDSSYLDIEFWVDEIGKLWQTFLQKCGMYCKKIPPNSFGSCSCSSSSSNSRYFNYCEENEWGDISRLNSSHMMYSSDDKYRVASNRLQQFHEDSDEDIESETCSYESDFDENIPEIDFNMTTSGGGERDPRIIDIQVKEAVIARSNGDCGHCGRLFKPWEVPQICHIQRHDSNGRYTEDNLIYGHTSCDALYDEGRIIHDPEGGYWIDKMIPNHEPDKKQVSQINPAYILHRWNWEKSRQLFEDVSDDDFRQYLELEYTHRTL